MVEYEVLWDDGTYHKLSDDPGLEPGGLRVQRQLEQEAAQARMRARMAAVDEAIEEDTARRDHLADRLKQAEDTFTAQMIAAAKEEL